MCWLVLLIFLLPLTLSAQVADSTSVTILVRDTLTLKAMPFVALIIGKDTLQTDWDGTVDLLLPVGKLIMFEASFVGYYTKVQGFLMKEKRKLVVVKLSPSSMLMDSVTCKGITIRQKEPKKKKTLNP